MPVIAILLGALLGGAASESPFGAAVGALIAWLLVRTQRQEKALAELQRSLLDLRRAGVQAPAAVAGAAPEATPASPSAIEPIAQPATPAPIAVAAATAEAASAGVTSAAHRASPEPVAVTPTPAAAPAIERPVAGPRRDLLAPAKAWLFGGNTIVKLGVAILFIGLAFLAKFASEHVQVPVEVRLALIGAAAIVLLAFGWRLRLRRAGYAQVLQGAAVAVLFLTLFAAFRAYHVMAALPVFVLMVAVAALAAALAVLQDARSLAVIGALGGFATPLLVSTGSGDHVALFSYYLVLDLGIAAVAWFKTWRSLNLVGFAFTFGVGALWGVFSYRSGEHYASCQAFLIAFFVLFNAILLMPARRVPSGATAVAAGAAAAAGRGREAMWVNGSLLFGLPTIAFALQLGMVRHWPYGSALSALALAAFYVVLSARLRRRAELRVAFEASLAIAVVFLTLVIPFALDARSTAGAWALEGAGLVWLGFRQGRRLARGFGYVLLLLAAPTLLHAFDRHGVPADIFNAYLFNGSMIVAGSLLAAHAVRRGAAASRAMNGEGAAEPLLVAWATLWALGTTALQIGQFVQEPYGPAAWLVAGSAIALGFIALSLKLDWAAAAWPPTLHALLLAGVALDALADLRQPLAQGGVWAWPVAIATHLAVLRFAARRWPVPALQGAVHVIGVLVLAVLGALGGRALTADWGDAASAWPWLGWLVVPALLLMALLRPGLSQRWPLAEAPRAYGLVAAGLLSLSLWLWTLAANAFSTGAARPLAHVPLLNPLDIGVGFALLGVWMWLRSPATQRAFAAQRWLTPGALGGAGFVWLNAMLIRAFHHYGGVPYRWHAWVRSLPVHTGITLLWTATALALMWFAARRAQRAPWIVGAVLLAAVVGKLVLVDLSGSGTVTRIVSFIGVGVLMLVIGYVAPLPSNAAKKAAADGFAGDPADAAAQGSAHGKL